MAGFCYKIRPFRTSHICGNIIAHLIPVTDNPLNEKTLTVLWKIVALHGVIGLNAEINNWLGLS